MDDASAPAQTVPPPSSKEDLELQKLKVEVEIKQKELAAFGKPASKTWWAIAVDLLLLHLRQLAEIEQPRGKRMLKRNRSRQA
jgi:hypothetical protein